MAQVFPPRKGGSGRWLWELYRRLPEFNVHVVAGDVSGAAVFDRTAGLAISRLPLDFPDWGIWDWRGGPRYVRALLALRRIVSRVRPDIIHCGKCLPEGFLAAMIKKWSGIPFVLYVHGEELTLARTSGQLRRLSGSVFRQAARVIANSDHTRRMLINDWGLREETVVVMHPGVDTSRFVPAPPDPEVRRRLGWTNRRVILTVGALQKRKGQDMLIRALPAIRTRCPDVLYAMVGEGWEREYLDEIVRAHEVSDLVQFRGIPDDAGLIECYQQCDVFALPNRQVGWDFEGFGIVLLEAQACGRPVIAGLSGGVPETVQPSRSADLLSCDSAEELGDVAMALLEDPDRRARMGASGRQWVVEHFDWDVLTHQARRLFTLTS
jgi:phosphatidyl-myo-inositol dimannoside synthase